MASLLSLPLEIIQGNRLYIRFIKNTTLMVKLLSFIPFVAFLVFSVPDAQAGETVLTNRLAKQFIADYGLGSVMNNPNITVRLSNPQFNCTTGIYCGDVEFQSDMANQQLSAMNVRFWYDDGVLELINFTGFQGGYGPAAPNPPQKTTSASIGPAWFNFAGAGEFVNGAMQLVNQNAPPIYISTSGWTKLFQLCFTIDDPNANYGNFWPSVVWDLEQNPANGGFISGNDGVVMSVVNPNGGSLAVDEHVNQFNWEYIGNGTPPYGQPVQTNSLNINCPPNLTCPANITIACGGSTLPSNTGSATATDYCAGNPTISYSDVISGPPCPQANVITRTWSATDNCNHTSTCVQSISVGGGSSPLVVNNTNDTGPGSLRNAIASANPGDTITFASSLAGLTITITSTKLILSKNLFIRSNVTPRIKISSSIPGLFDLTTGITVEVKDLDVTSGISTANNDGAAFNNLGTLKLVGVKVLKNPNLPTGQYLIRNKPSSTITMIGNCFIQIN